LILDAPERDLKHPTDFNPDGINMLRQQQQLTVSISLSADTIAALSRQIQGCEACSEHATLRLAELLTRLTGYRESPADYVIADDIHCPLCVAALAPHSLVKIRAGIGRAAAMGLSS
jgi:hypothetical protein